MVFTLHVTDDIYRQHFTRLKAMYGTAGGQEASTVTTAPSAPRTRKRKAAALEDDEEIDTPATPVKSKKGKKGKRAKDATKQVSSNPVKNEETEDEEVLPDLAKTPVLAEESYESLQLQICDLC